MRPAQEIACLCGSIQRHILAVSEINKNSLDCFIDLGHKERAEHGSAVAHGYRQGRDICVEVSLGIEAALDSSLTPEQAV